MGTLTVYENLMFSANLRLNKKLSAASRHDIVEETIEVLGLTACANTKVSATSYRNFTLLSLKLLAFFSLPQ